MNRYWKTIAVAFVGCILASAQSTATLAADTMKTIMVEHPWARATAPGIPTGAIYLTIHNMGGEDDKLLSASSPVAKTVEIHQTTMNGDVMHMAPVAGGLAIPAKGTVTFEPSGYHVMLIGLKQPLKAGEKVDLSLTFAKAGTIEVDAVVEAATAAPAMDMHDSMPGMH